MSSTTAPNCAVNLSLTAQNVAVAKDLGINLSDVADRAIADAVARGYPD